MYRYFNGLGHHIDILNFKARAVPEHHAIVNIDEYL